MASKKITEKSVKQMTIGDELRDTDLTGFFVRCLATKTTFYLSYISPETGRRNNIPVGDYGALTVDEARKLAKSKAADVTKGLDPAVMKQKIREKSKVQKQKTLDVFLDNGFKSLTPKKQYDKSVKVIRREFKDYLFIDMNTIQASDLNKWKLAHPRKPGTVNRYLNDLRGALTKAVSEGILKKSPMPDVKPLKEDRKKRIRFLTLTEEAILMDALDDRQTFHRHGGNNYSSFYMDKEGQFTDHLKPIVIIGIYAGLRPGEIFNLRVKDLDFDSRRLFIKGEADNKSKGTKSMQTRIIPMGESLILTGTFIQYCSPAQETG